MGDAGRVVPGVWVSGHWEHVGTVLDDSPSCSRGRGCERDTTPLKDSSVPERSGFVSQLSSWRRAGPRGRRRGFASASRTRRTETLQSKSQEGRPRPPPRARRAGSLHSAWRGRRRGLPQGQPHALRCPSLGGEKRPAGTFRSQAEMKPDLGAGRKHAKRPAFATGPLGLRADRAPIAATKCASLAKARLYHRRGTK